MELRINCVRINRSRPVTRYYTARPPTVHVIVATRCQAQMEGVNKFKHVSSLDHQMSHQKVLDHAKGCPCTGVGLWNPCTGVGLGILVLGGRAGAGVPWFGEGQCIKDNGHIESSPHCGHTETTENITSMQLRFRAVIPNSRQASITLLLHHKSWFRAPPMTARRVRGREWLGCHAGCQEISSKQGYQWSNKKDSCPPIYF